MWGRFFQLSLGFLDMKKEIKITGLDGLKTMPFEKFVDFQGKLKKPIEPAQLEKLKNSIVKHGIFVPKFVWFDDAGQAMTVDGHQTLSALRGLHEDGYAIPDIPYVEIDAQGAQDAAEKLLQINSRYAMIDPEGALEWLQDFDFEPPDIKEMVESIEISELKEIEFNVEDHLNLNEFDDFEGEGHKQPLQRFIITYETDEQKQAFLKRFELKEKVVFSFSELNI